MTREELTGYDGREGRPAYAAVNGKIYDFTGSKLWRRAITCSSTRPARI